MFPNDGTPLGQVRAWLSHRLRDGVACPACGQHAEVYRRRVSRSMIDVMLAMWRDQRRQSAESGGSPSRKWVYLPGIHQRTRDVATCRYFGLIERSPDGEAGWWRVTRHGHDFLNGTAEIAEWVEVFDNQVVGFGPQMIGVNDVAHGFSLRAELEGHDDGKDERRDERDSEGRS